MFSRRVLSVFAALLLVLGATTASSLPLVTTPGADNPFIIRAQTVRIEVFNHLARTTVVQEIVNTGSTEIPCSIDMKLPDGARASGFWAMVDGQALRGVIRTNQEARRIVEEAREQKKAAALAVEQPDGSLHLELSQVKAGQQFYFSISYIEQARFDSGWFVYDFNIKGHSPEVGTPVSVHMLASFRTTAEILAIESPTHTLIGGVRGKSAVMEVEDAGVRPGVFTMKWQLDLKPGVPHVMMKGSGDEDPYFSLLMMPPDTPPSQKGRSFVLILDKSGSMEGDAFTFACKAMVEFIQGLRDSDLINVIVFDSVSTNCSPFPFMADAAGKQAAIDFIARYKAVGGTRFLEPLSTAIKSLKLDPDHLPFVILFTDGEDNNDKASAFVTRLRAEDAFVVPVFTLAFGGSVDFALLRALAEESGATHGQILAEQEIPAVLNGIRSRLDGIAGRDLSVTTEGKLGYHKYPAKQSVLFRDTPVALYGRLEKDKEIKLSIGAETTDNWEGATLDLSTAGVHADCDFIDQMWATKRMQALLDNISIFGFKSDPAIKLEVIELSRRFLITSPYTSLVFSEASMPEEEDVSAAEAMQLLLYEERIMSTSQGSYGARRGGKRSASAKAAGGIAPAANPAPDARAESLKNADEPAKTKGPAPLFDDKGVMCDKAGTPVADQATASAYYAWLRIARGNSGDDVDKAVAALAKAVGEKSIPEDAVLVRAIAAELTLALPADKRSALDAAACVALLASAKTDGLTKATDEYIVMLALSLERFVRRGGVLPETLKKAVKAEIEKRADIELAKAPVGKDIAYIGRWNKWFIPMVVVSGSLGLTPPADNLRPMLLDLALAENAQTPFAAPDYARLIALLMVDVPENLTTRRDMAKRNLVGRTGKVDSLFDTVLGDRASEASGW